MSYSVFLQCFSGGDAATFDARTIEDLLAPYVAVRDERFGFTQLALSDGGSADVYYSSAGGTLDSMMFTRFSSGEILDLIARLALSVDGVVMLQEGTALLTSAAQHQDLPEELRDDTAVIKCGADIQAVFDRDWAR